MTETEVFDFRRARGIVWVCDIVQSSKYLNDNTTTDAFELFLPRLHWLAMTVVRATGGIFIKWTGDGFLAWFETPLIRQMGEQVSAILYALWQLTAIVNVTKLGVESEATFLISHGIAFEQDALLTRITHLSGHQELDIIGRSVVLAFRLSGVHAAFPSVVTQREIAIAARDKDRDAITFTSWRPTTEERLRYFKGEKFGTANLYKSIERKPPRVSTRALLRNAKTIVAELDNSAPEIDSPHLRFSKELVLKMNDGPEWAKDVLATYGGYVQDDLLGAVKKVVQFLEARTVG